MPHVRGPVRPVLSASLLASGRWQHTGDDELRWALRASLPNLSVSRSGYLADVRRSDCQFELHLDRGSVRRRQLRSAALARPETSPGSAEAHPIRVGEPSTGQPRGVPQFQLCVSPPGAPRRQSRSPPPAVAGCAAGGLRGGHWPEQGGEMTVGPPDVTFSGR